VLRKIGKEREGKTLSGHQDIVAGCRFTPDSSRLLSWSYDGTLCIWDATSGKLIHTLTGHEDRVTAAAITPDGRVAVSGGRDGSIKVWDLQQGRELATQLQVGEIRGCFCLADGQSVVTVDANGWLVLLGIPALELQTELNTGLKVMCGDLALASNQIALGGENGQVSLVALEGFEDTPLLVIAKRGVKTASTFFTRLLGHTKNVTTYHYTCPACQQTLETNQMPDKAFPCSHCQRPLRMTNPAPQLQNQ
jgi:WD40 repeat protein